jgi:ribosomal-protein-alanine N-acetyltransferase
MEYNGGKLCPRCPMKKDLIYRLFSHIPTLETDRLTLRGMRVSDASDMYEYARRPSVTEYLTWEPHASVEETREYLTYVGQRYRTGDFYDWSVVDKETGRMIGTCGFTSFNCPADSAEIGYVLNPAFQGRGLATEAVQRVLQYGFEELNLHRIEAHFIEGNDASRRLMERVGMTFEGFARESMRIKGKYRTIGTCAILRSEFA